MIRVLSILRVIAAGVAMWMVSFLAVAGSVAGFRFSEDGRQLVLSVTGIGEVPCHWAATVEERGGLKTLDPETRTGKPEARVSESPGGGTTVVLRFEDSLVELWFQVQVEGGNLFSTRVGVKNTSAEAIRFIEAFPLRIRLPYGNPDGWLITGLHPRTPDMVPLPPPAGGVGFHEQGMFYKPDGTGFVFGPVGEPVSYCGFSWFPEDAGVASMEAVSSMDGVIVDPGETRWGQEVALVSGQPQAALAQWADSVARSHGARKVRHSLSGWNNWNYLSKKDVTAELADIVRTVQGSEGRLRPAVIQMDYNFHDADLKKTLASDWAPQCRKNIQAIGARFGTHVGVGGPGWPGLAGLPELQETITRAVQGGFGYLKVFYPPVMVKSDGRRTAFEIYRDHWSSIRKAAGEETYLLFCDYEPNRAAVGWVDASRVGPDADRGKIRQAIPSALRAYALHDRWFSMDVDSYFTGTDIANISRIEGSWPLVRTWLSMTGLSCGSAITSDPWYWQDFKPYWRNVEILTPSASERTEVMDLGTDKEWTRLLGRFRREWGTSTVALLWNPGDTERTVTLDFAKAGMDPKMRHAVWSFWDDRYLGVAQGTWTSSRLGPAASQHLVFTPLPERPTKPVLIGSNLHIYCGAAEIKRVETSRSSFAVELTDAGARDGELYLYSPMQPVLAAATGCTVSGITSAGENVWRVSLHDRKSGVPQRVAMKILLPVSSQPWFWALIITAVASLLFSAWRYVVGLRLERARALDQERARIARDIHDDLGASLTHIALLGELAQSEIDSPARTRTHVDDIFRAASKLTRSVDEIVWALNPSNDTIVRFAAYAGDFVQDFLQSAGVDCRLSIPPDLPDEPLAPKTRHALFLVIKEALHNIVSHSQAACVRIAIAMDRGVLRITISDDGRGFDPLSAAPSRPGGGHGLANMRQRVEDVGGVLDIASEPGHGAAVTIAIHP